MKAILMSIKPKWVAKILNGEKTIEIRKKFPSDYVGWVYIYVTKGKPLVKCSNGKWYVKDKDFKYDMTFSYYAGFNGKVVARFWCDKVEEIEPRIIKWEMKHETNNMSQNELLKQACLNIVELLNYCGGVGCAIHIIKLEIFDKPKEISDFKVKHYPQYAGFVKNKTHYELAPLTRAPQSWCWIEI